jgi:retron-type reverse transcriptase
MKWVFWYTHLESMLRIRFRIDGIFCDTARHRVKLVISIRVCRRSLASGYYHPMPLRQLFIPKKAGGWRELGVPTVRDRFVQHALLNILYPLLEPQIKTEDRRSKSEGKIRGRKR